MATMNNHATGIGANGLPVEGKNLPQHMTPLSDERPTRTSSNKLEDQAATAALYVTNQNNHKPKSGYEFLDSDNKLSSAGAAASLKYAKSRDLPSYPSSGLNNNQSAAGAAASMGWQNQKTFEHWKPDPSASASAAAMLAKDYKMKPAWQPESSAHGAKAALLAHQASKGVDSWHPEPTAWGNSAATQAMKKGNTLSPQLSYGHTAVGRQGSLLAATGAMSNGRKRANSTPLKTSRPETYPDEANAASNALKAAVSVHKSQTGTGQGIYVDEPNVSSNALKAAVSVHKSQTVRKPNTFEKGVGSVPFTTMPREMYTSNPPVEQFDQDLNKDQNREDILKASAIAMAKKMYNQQQKQFDDASHAKSGAAAAHSQRRLSIDSDDEPTPMRFDNLQERAQQLANQRLSKMSTEEIQNREYRDYYGGAPSVSSRLSIRGRTRRRASSYDEDRHQSEKIRAQMNLFSSNISQVDEKKRQRDRESLIAAAQRNVNKSLHGMDERVFADTGKVAPSLLNEWELKAHQAAQAKSEARLENFGKVDIGGGKFVDQSVIDAAAAKNIQPVLDEMNTKADAQRFRDAELKIDEENRRRKSQEAKVREKESKDIAKKLKQQEKEEEKERKADEKAAQKEHRKSTKSEPDIPMSTISPTPTTGEPERPTTAPASAPVRRSTERRASARITGATGDTNASQQPTSNTESPTAESGSRVKSWLKSKFDKVSRHSKSLSTSSITKDTAGTEKGFVGGHTYTGASVNGSNTSLSRHSVQDIANATLVPGASPAVAPTREPEEFEKASGSKEKAEDDVSILSEYSHHGGDKGKGKDEIMSGDEDVFLEARDNFDEDLAPPRPFSQGGKSVSPGRAAKFHEDI
ncbi:Eisosome assembly protein [Ciborinia camelliae]|nr:Eisosome assembly protein [Ciborinia camelliae]